MGDFMKRIMIVLSIAVITLIVNLSAMEPSSTPRQRESNCVKKGQDYLNTIQQEFADFGSVAEDTLARGNKIKLDLMNHQEGLLLREITEKERAIKNAITRYNLGL
jgi:hypothetical protein